MMMITMVTMMIMTMTMSDDGDEDSEFMSFFTRYKVYETQFSLYFGRRFCRFFFFFQIKEFHSQ